MFVSPDSSNIIALALAEDFGVAPERFGPSAEGDPALLECDVTSFSAIGLDARFSGTIVARQACVVAGLPLVAEVYDTLSAAAGLIDPVEVFPLVAEGTRVRVGTAVAEVEGIAAAVLAGERTALDFLMQLSGIATHTAEWVKAAGGRFDVCDTRKTPPGFRALAKYAVRVGGGMNHRFGLYDMVLVKDNHIRRAGGITAAVAEGACRSAGPARRGRGGLAVPGDRGGRSGRRPGAARQLRRRLPQGRGHRGADRREKAGREVLIEASGGMTLSRARRASRLRSRPREHECAHHGRAGRRLRSRRRAGRGCRR